MIFFAIAMAFVIGISIASVLWSREVKNNERRDAINKSPEMGHKPPFRRAPGVLTEAEAPIFKMLKYVIADDGHVLAKVQLASLVTMAPDEGRREFYMNIARSRVVDFVICHSKSMAPVLVIQAVDTGVKISNEEQEFLQTILDAAGLPLLKLSARESLGPVEMKHKLREAMNQLPAGETSSSHAA